MSSVWPASPAWNTNTVTFFKFLQLNAWAVFSIQKIRIFLLRLPATLDCWLSVKEVVLLPNARQKKTKVWSVCLLVVWVGGCCGDITQDSQPDPRAKVAGSGAVGRQQNWVWGLGVTIENSGVCGEVAWAFPRPAVVKCEPSVARFTRFQKKQAICGVVFFRDNFHIRYTNPNEFLHMYTFRVCNHHLWKAMEHFSQKFPLCFFPSQ